jgi:hypothetical protein
VDDVTLGFDMAGSGSVARLNELPGLPTMRGKMLGERTSWGKWAHWFGRSAAFWKADTSRLYVQAKLAPEGELCPPDEFRRAADLLMERMALLGVTSWEPPWVTRIDVAVDASCASADGKLLLDALEAARLPNGWRTTSTGTPRSTVYFRAARSEKVVARAYCRNLKLRRDEPFGLIRLEASQRYAPKQLLLSEAGSAAYLGGLWMSRFGGLAARVVRLPAEAQAMELGRRVGSGELRSSQAERLNLFLTLERLGLGSECYSKPIYAARRREAAKLGYGANDASAALEIELGDLLQPYREAVGLDLAA